MSWCKIFDKQYCKYWNEYNVQRGEKRMTNERNKNDLSDERLNISKLNIDDKYKKIIINSIIEKK